MKLSTDDSTVLARIALQGDETMRESARLLGKQFYTVQRAVQRGLRAGSLRRIWLFEPAALGLCRIQCLFSLVFDRKESREKLISLCKASPSVAFFAEIGGEYEFEAVFLVENAVEAMQTLEELLAKAGAKLRIKSIARQNRIVFFRKKYLIPPELIEKSEPYLEICARAHLPVVDEVDQRILYALAKDPNHAKGQIARTVGISALTLDRRMTRMRADGVLVGSMWHLISAAVGVQYFKLIATLGAGGESQRRALLSFAAQQRFVTTYRENVGDSDIDLGVEVFHLSDLLNVREEFVRKFSRDVQKVSVVPRFAMYKFEPYPLTRVPQGIITEPHSES